MNHSLTTFLQSIRTDVINSMQAKGKPPSANTLSDMKIAETANGAQLELPGFLNILETGRKPTSKSAQRSEPAMITRIKEWCREKNIPEREAWAIKKAIDKHGFKGTPGLLGKPLSQENIDQRLNPVVQQMATKVIESLISPTQPSPKGRA